MTILELINAANSGLMLWSVVGPIIQTLFAKGGTVTTVYTMVEVLAAKSESQAAIDQLQADVNASKASGM
jgi:hypothetical protein